MARGKTQVRRIEKDANRQVTFSKRKNGLLKKAFELSVLCDVEIAVIVFSPRGRIFEFASSSMIETIQKYKKCTMWRVQSTIPPSTTMQQSKDEIANMMKRIQQLEASKRKLQGEDLATCTLEEVNQLEEQIMRSLDIIRSRKVYLYEKKIKQLKEKGKALAPQNSNFMEEVNYSDISGSLKDVDGSESDRMVPEASDISGLLVNLCMEPQESGTQVNPNSYFLFI